MRDMRAIAAVSVLLLVLLEVAQGTRPGRSTVSDAAAIAAAARRPGRAALGISPQGHAVSYAALSDSVVHKSKDRQRGDRQRGENVQAQYYSDDVVMELQCVHCLMGAAGRDYAISEGTLLGAARNGFFLPWDTDGDIIFDLRGKDGKADYDGFYRLFTPGGISSADLSKCPDCGDVSVSLFTPGYTADGVELHYWQTYDDILSGNLLELHSEADGTKRQVSDEDHERILKETRKFNPGRIHFSPEPAIRNGGRGYLDIAAYEFDGEGNLTIFESPNQKLHVSDVMPFQRCSVRHFGADKVQTVDLSCPARPSAYLSSLYGEDWSVAPYNSYEDGTWVHNASVGSLELFLRKTHGYDGPLEPSC